jgi:hypothetical protein
MAEESLTLFKIYLSEEDAYCTVDELNSTEPDEDIEYFYEEHEVEQ